MYKFTKTDRVWFTSDLHFYHKNIIQYCDRPYKDVFAMNETLIANYNYFVKEGDFAFILGDFAFAGKEVVENLLTKMNGRKILVLGNHDRRQSVNTLGWQQVEKTLEIEVDGQLVVLNHKPYDEKFIDRKLPLLHGHCHSIPEERKRLTDLNTPMYDVGVDANNYYPVSLEFAYTQLGL